MRGQLVEQVLNTVNLPRSQRALPGGNVAVLSILSLPSANGCLTGFFRASTVERNKTQLTPAIHYCARDRVVPQIRHFLKNGITLLPGRTFSSWSRGLDHLSLSVGPSSVYLHGLNQLRHSTVS